MAERPHVYRVGRSANHTINHTALAGQVAEYLQLRGAWVLRVRGGLGQRRGVPDVLACFPVPADGVWVGCGAWTEPPLPVGRMVSVEVKTGRGKLTATQQQERDSLRRAGAVYCECRSLDDLETALLKAGLIAERSLWPRREKAGR